MRFHGLGVFLLAQAALSTALVIPKLDGELKTQDLGVKMSYSQIVRLECTGCPGEGRKDLLFDFNLATSQPTSMTLNSIPIFPLKNPVPIKLQAPMISHDVSTLDYFSNPDAFENVDVGYSMMFTDSKRFFPTPSKIHSIELQILSVAHQPVDIKGIALDVAEDVDNGNLAIGSTRIMPLSEKCPTYECLLNKMMTKIRNSAQGVRSRLPGCGGRDGPTGHGFPPVPAPQRFDHGRGRPHHGRPHPYMRPHRSFMERAFEEILLPVFIGLCAGMLFGAFVLAAVHGACAVMRHIRKGRAGRQERRQQRRERRRLRRECRFAKRFGCKRPEEGRSEEKEALMTADIKDDIEAPPMYTDVEIGEGLEVVERK